MSRRTWPRAEGLGEQGDWTEAWNWVRSYGIGIFR
jgi:hypothetical protein